MAAFDYLSAEVEFAAPVPKGPLKKSNSCGGQNHRPYRKHDADVLRKASPPFPPQDEMAYPTAEGEQRD